MRSLHLPPLQLSHFPPIAANWHLALVCKNTSVFPRLWERVLGYGMENSLVEKRGLNGSVGPISVSCSFSTNTQGQILQLYLRQNHQRFQGDLVPERTKRAASYRYKDPRTVLAACLSAASGVTASYPPPKGSATTLITRRVL